MRKLKKQPELFCFTSQFFIKNLGFKCFGLTVEMHEIFFSPQWSPFISICLLRVCKQEKEKYNLFKKILSFNFHWANKQRTLLSHHSWMKLTRFYGVKNVRGENLFLYAPQITNKLFAFSKTILYLSAILYITFVWILIGISFNNIHMQYEWLLK